jgi:hypothetical protein
MRIININTAFSTIRTIDLTDFVCLIESVKMPDHQNKIVFTKYTEQDFIQNKYVHPINSITFLEISIDYLKKQTKNLTLSKRNLFEIIEDVSNQCIVEMGNPKHLVRLSPRTWLLGDPKDFVIYFNKNGFSLNCIYSNRNFVCNIERKKREVK